MPKGKRHEDHPDVQALDEAIEAGVEGAGNALKYLAQTGLGDETGYAGAVDGIESDG